MLLEILIGIIFFLILVILYLILQNNGLKNALNVPSKQTPFDQYLSNGMDIVNEFLKITFEKFINNRLIQNAENTEMSVTKLFNDLRDNESMEKFVSGYVTLVSTTMSKDLKLLFNRYYNVIDDHGKINDIYISYISEWCILKIRSMQAQSTLFKLDNGIDYSTKKNLEANASMFLEIETTLYKDLKIIEEPKNEKQ